MTIKLVLGVALAAVLTITSAIGVTAESIGEFRAPAPVVFVCRNGVAMSVWSAAYFNRLAERRGLRERHLSRGHPELPRGAGQHGARTCARRFSPRRPGDDTRDDVLDLVAGEFGPAYRPVRVGEGMELGDRNPAAGWQ